MVRERLDGLWAWGSVTEASKFLQNIHPKSAVTYQRALMKTTGGEARVRTVRGICCLRWSHRVTAEPPGQGGTTGREHRLCLLSGTWTWFEDKQKPPSSALAAQVQIHFIWIQIHSGWVSLADFAVCSPPAVKNQSSALQNQAQLTVHCARFTGSAKPDISHVLMSYLRRCLSHRRMPSPWKYRSLLPSSPAGRRSASRSCPECICRCRYTSQGIPLQGKQPHIQMRWKDKATQPWKRPVRQLFPFAFSLFLHSRLLASHLKRTVPVWCWNGGDHSMGCCLPGGHHSTASLIGSRERWASGRQWDLPALWVSQSICFVRRGFGVT